MKRRTFLRALGAGLAAVAIPKMPRALEARGFPTGGFVTPRSRLLHHQGARIGPLTGATIAEWQRQMIVYGRAVLTLDASSDQEETAEQARAAVSCEETP